MDGLQYRSLCLIEATRHDNSAATSFAYALYMLDNNARSEISIPKRYWHTYRRKTRCEAGLAASR